jgi:tetratricopeptide (TPR) repeat protein
VARDADQLYIDEKDRVWIPVETTILGRRFSEAWKIGAEMLAEREYAIIETREAWKVYRPLHLPDEAVLTAVPTREEIWPLFREDLKIQERTLISDRVRKIQQRLEEDPGDVLSLNALGILLAKNGYLRQAEARFREVIELEPDFAGGYSNLANVFYEREKYAEAEEGYLKALELDPASPEVHVELALTYCETGRFDRARVHYRLAMELGAGDGEDGSAGRRGGAVARRQFG